MLKNKISIVLLLIARFIDKRGDQLADWLVHKSFDLTDYPNKESQEEQEKIKKELERCL